MLWWVTSIRFVIFKPQENGFPVCYLSLWRIFKTFTQFLNCKQKKINKKIYNFSLYYMPKDSGNIKMKYFYNRMFQFINSSSQKINQVTYLFNILYFIFNEPNIWNNECRWILDVGHPGQCCGCDNVENTTNNF